MKSLQKTPLTAEVKTVTPREVLGAVPEGLTQAQQLGMLS